MFIHALGTHWFPDHFKHIYIYKGMRAKAKSWAAGTILSGAHGYLIQPACGQAHCAAKSSGLAVMF